MKRKRLSLVLGVISGILCAICVLAYTQSVQGEAESLRAEALERYGGDQVEVCVATRDIAAGEEISSSNVEMQLWVADLLPQGAVTSLQEIAGKTLGSPIYAGEVVTTRRLSSGESTLVEVPEGMSVLSVPVQDVQAIGGSVTVGMQVDLYATGATGTDLLVSRALVMMSSAVDEDGQLTGSTTWVTLAIPPESVQEVVTASQMLELYLVLPGTDLDTTDDQGLDIQESPDEADETDSTIQSTVQEGEDL